jgi:hypothetical protein
MICHSLYPLADGDWLSPLEVVERLRSVFADVRVDAGEGIAHARKILQRLRQLNAPADVIDHLERTYEDALAVAVFDRSGVGEQGVSFVITPQESIKIYHEAAQFSFVERCAKILRYEIMEL